MLLSMATLVTGAAQLRADKSPFFCVKRCPIQYDFRTGAKARGGTLGISGWGCAAGTLEPLTYTRASSAEFCYPILE